LDAAAIRFNGAIIAARIFLFGCVREFCFPRANRRKQSVVMAIFFFTIKSH
jgi:hypothetical protein